MECVMEDHEVAVNDVGGPRECWNRSDESLIVAAMLVQKRSEDLVNNNERACIHVDGDAVIQGDKLWQSAGMQLA